MTPLAPAREPQVELTFPAGSDMWALARMCVSALAAQLDFTIEAVEDLRLAVNELCRSCAEGASRESSVTLLYTWSDDTLDVRCRTDGLGARLMAASEPNDLSPAELSDKILEALTKEHGFERENETTRMGWFSMERERIL